MAGWKFLCNIDLIWDLIKLQLKTLSFGLWLLEMTGIVSKIIKCWSNSKYSDTDTDTDTVNK